MVRIGTTCKDCCFLKDNTKCLHNLLDVFLDRGAEITSDETGITIDRVCRYQRLIDWEKDKTIEERLAISKEEVYICGSIILLADTSKQLENTISKLNLKKPENFNFVIIHKDIKMSDLLGVCGNNIKSNYKLMYYPNQDAEHQIYKALDYARNGYIFILDCSKDFDENIVDKVNNLVNNKLFRVLHIEGIDGIHQSVSMVHLYKYIKGDIQCSIKEKINNIAEEENSNPQIFNWKEVDEEYIN